VHRFESSRCGHGLTARGLLREHGAARVKAKIRAAIENTSVKALVKVLWMDLVEAHWQELKKKRLLPEGKRTAKD